MTDKEALMRVLTLLHKDAEGAPPEAMWWWAAHEDTLWRLEGMLDALEEDDE